MAVKGKLVLLSLLFLSSQVIGQGIDFSISNPFKLTLEYNSMLFNSDKEIEDEYQKSMIAYLVLDTLNQYKVKVKARGKNRKENCDNPPIKIKFSKKTDYELDLFNSSSSLKIVRTCKKGSSMEQVLVKEYLVYKMYKEITNYSFRTYFMEIDFVDISDSNNNYTSYAFAIESINNLQTRTQTIKYTDDGYGLNHFDADETKKLCVFQWMINNYDWNSANYHNLKAVKPDKKAPVLIPYDFDFSRIVNSSYSYAPSSLGVKSLNQRKYVGISYSYNQLDYTIELFLSKKNSFINLVSNCTLLNADDKTDMLLVLNSFYTLIGNKKNVKKSVEKQEVTPIIN